MRIRAFAALAAVTWLLAGVTSPAHAEPGYPNQQIRFLVPYAAGGLPDVVARFVAEKLGERLGKPIIIENRPGGNGGVAASAFLSAPADGYTFMVTDGSMLTINPVLYNSLSYDVKRDFEPVALLARSPLFLASHPSIPVKSLSEFIAYVKANPGKVNYGSSGIGSSHHLSMEAFKAALGLDMNHIPFRGSAQSVPALLGGHVQALFSAYPSLAGSAEQERVHVLATNGQTRSSLLPKAPPVADVIPGFDFSVMIGILARTGTPKSIIDKVAAEAVAVSKLDSLKKQYEAAGIEPSPGGPTVYKEALQAETDRVAAVVQASKISIKN